jgi:DNA-binding NtrC family response regulator
VGVIYLPPLRERREDVLSLANHFLKKYSEQGKRLTSEAKNKLLAYSWPANVGQLENVIKRAIALSDDCMFIETKNIELDDFGIIPGRAKGAGNDLDDIYDRNEDLDGMRLDSDRRFVEKALSEFNGSRKLAAERLGKNERTFYNILNKLKKAS